LSRAGWLREGSAFMRRYLVVAYRTLGTPRLTATLHRLATEPAEFFVVVPATRPTERELAWLRSEHIRPAVGESASMAVARWALRAAVERWRRDGLHVAGEVGEPDPFRAVMSVTRDGVFTSVIVSTLPRPVSQWMRTDFPGRLRRALSMPVIHVEAQEPGSISVGATAPSSTV
jgi:hypothetical protein